MVNQLLFAVVNQPIRFKHNNWGINLAGYVTGYLKLLVRANCGRRGKPVYCQRLRADLIYAC